MTYKASSGTLSFYSLLVPVSYAQLWNSQHRVDVEMNWSTVVVAAVYVHRGVGSEVVGHGMVADADPHLREWKDPPRGALQQHRNVLSQSHFGLILEAHEVQPTWPLCRITSTSTMSNQECGKRQQSASRLKMRIWRMNSFKTVLYTSDRGYLWRICLA